MSETYEIAWVGDKTRPWNNKYGNFIDYRVAVQDREGTLSLSQKADTPPPKVGDEVYGHIEEEEVTPRNGEPFTAYKLKKDQNPNGPKRVDANKAARQAGWTRNASLNGFDEREARIERMAAHKAAAVLTGPNGDNETFERWLAFLSKDLDAYTQARGISETKPTAESPPPPDSTPEPSLEDAVLADTSDIPF